MVNDSTAVLVLHAGVELLVRRAQIPDEGLLSVDADIRAVCIQHLLIQQASGDMVHFVADVLQIYRNKDVVEKLFDDLKNALDMKRLRIRSAWRMSGRVFKLSPVCN